MAAQFTIYCNREGRIFSENPDEIAQSILAEVFTSVEEKKADADEYFRIDLRVYSLEHLTSRSYNSEILADGDSVFQQDQLRIKPKTPIYPMVHLPMLDIFAADQAVNLTSSGVPRYIKVMDSSIWNYCVPLVDSKCAEKLQQVLKTIVGHYASNRYDLNVTREYADLNARLVRESFLKGTSAHGDYVSPFLFHAETEMCQKIAKEFGFDIKTGQRVSDAIENYDQIANQKWRILLVDDKATKPLSNYLEKADASDACLSQNCKLNILVGLFRQLGFKVGYRTETGLHDVDKDTQVVFYCAQTVGEALQLLRDYKFEIILLDYLLDWSETATSKEYGWQILTRLQQEGKPESEYKFGPNKRMFFMFISAFRTAVSERLLAEGLHRSEKFWHIAEGACPTNTPNLFLYNILHLMKKRVNDSGLRLLTLEGICKNALHKIYRSKNIRQAANDEFPKVLALLYYYKNLLDDAAISSNGTDCFNTEESVLATSFVMSHPRLGGLLEHLTQLVYLSAFGTVRQWPEMWEEYLYVSAMLEAEQTEDRQTMRDGLDAVEEYIMRLKDNSL